MNSLVWHSEDIHLHHISIPTNPNMTMTREIIIIQEGPITQKKLRNIIFILVSNPSFNQTKKKKPSSLDGWADAILNALWGHSNL